MSGLANVLLAVVGLYILVLTLTCELSFSVIKYFARCLYCLKK